VESRSSSLLGIRHCIDLVSLEKSALEKGQLISSRRGIAATLQAAAFNWEGMMVCRFFLAMAEAGYGPGLPYLLSFFYMRDEIGLRCGIFLSAAPLATCFAGALAYGITSGHASIENWKLLFLVEGLPSICMAFVALRFMPDSPEKARFLDAEEKEVARARAIRQVGQESAERVGSISLKDVGEALLDVKNWLTAVSVHFRGSSETLGAPLTNNSSCTSPATSPSPRSQSSCPPFS
jgi:MFS family permease